MKKNTGHLLVIAGFLPFLFKLPYMLNAWLTSPLDRYDAVFIVLFALSAGAGLARMPEKGRQYIVFFSAVMVIGGAGFGLGLLKQINALSIVGGIVFAWGTFGLIRGWSGAFHLMPAFGLLLLSCTSSTYIMAFLTGGDGLSAKVVAAVLLIVWQVVNVVLCKTPSINHVLFGAAAALLIMLYAFGGGRYQTFGPFLPEVDELRRGEFLGKIEEPSDEDYRFFGKSRIERRFFAGDENDRQIHLLMVGNFESVHNIHPAGHCMRTRGFDVISEKIHLADLVSGKLQVTEIVAENGGSKALFWVWYSNPEYSSGSFLFFRGHYLAGRQWQTYQVAAPIVDNNIEGARKTLTDFLNDMGKK